MRATALEFDVEDVLFRSFRTGDSITVDGLEIEPVHVDHSVPEPMASLFTLLVALLFILEILGLMERSLR